MTLFRQITWSRFEKYQIHQLLGIKITTVALSGFANLVIYIYIYITITVEATKELTSTYTYVFDKELSNGLIVLW